MKDFIPKIKSKVAKEVCLDGSKSISNRSLIIAAMAKGQTRFKNLPNSADVLACVQALKDLGCEIEHDQENKFLIIKGCDGEFRSKKTNIFCNESGTLTRFIIPMCAIQKSGEYYIYAKQRMMDRPLEGLTKPLESLGVAISYSNKKYHMPLTVFSKSLTGGNLEVDGQKSSQFASGVLMAAPFMRNGLELESITDHKQPYLEMTTKVMAEFGVHVEIESNTYKVNNAKYTSPREYIVEPDISTASYFWAFAAITGSKIKVKNVTKESKQGDIKFLNVLEQMGCSINFYEDGIEVERTCKLKGVRVSMRNFSDTFMTLASIACFAEGETYISGLSHTRGQESDRVSAMAEGLGRLGMHVETTQDSISISPQKSSFKPAEVRSHNDHRIAMSLALLGLKYDGVLVDEAEAVKKTCPDYFDRMRALVG